MIKDIENELLATKTLQEFKELIFKYKIKTINSLDQKVMDHWNNLFSDKSSAEKPNEPRKM